MQQVAVFANKFRDRIYLYLKLLLVNDRRPRETHWVTYDFEKTGIGQI